MIFILSYFTIWLITFLYISISYRKDKKTNLYENMEELIKYLWLMTFLWLPAFIIYFIIFIYDNFDIIENKYNKYWEKFFKILNKDIFK